MVFHNKLSARDYMQGITNLIPQTIHSILPNPKMERLFNHAYSDTTNSIENLNK